MTAAYETVGINIRIAVEFPYSCLRGDMEISVLGMLHVKMKTVGKSKGKFTAAPFRKTVRAMVWTVTEDQFPVVVPTAAASMPVTETPYGLLDRMEVVPSLVDVACPGPSVLYRRLGHEDGFRQEQRGPDPGPYSGTPFFLEFHALVEGFGKLFLAEFA